MASNLETPLDLLLLTADPNPDSVLPALSLLAHHVRCAPTEVSSLLEAGSADVALVDARTDLAAARDDKKRCIKYLFRQIHIPTGCN